MDSAELRNLLDCVVGGGIGGEDAAHRLCVEPFIGLGYAKPDMHRGILVGVSEVIYGASKTANQMCSISKAVVDACCKCRNRHRMQTTQEG